MVSRRCEDLVGIQPVIADMGIFAIIVKQVEVTQDTGEKFCSGHVRIRGHSADAIQCFVKRAAADRLEHVLEIARRRRAQHSLERRRTVGSALDWLYGATVGGGRGVPSTELQLLLVCGQGGEMTSILVTALAEGRCKVGLVALGVVADKLKGRALK